MKQCDFRTNFCSDVPIHAAWRIAANIAKLPDLLLDDEDKRNAKEVDRVAARRPWSIDHSPSTRRCSSRISSAILARDRRTRLGGLHISRCVHLGPDAPVSEPIIPVGDRKGLLADLAARFGWRPYMVTEKFVNRFASRTGVPNVGIR
jgi:hypothetical protein